VIEKFLQNLDTKMKCTRAVDENRQWVNLHDHFATRSKWNKFSD